MRSNTNAIFEIEIEVNENETKTEQITVEANSVDWETEVVDEDRQMGAELAHIGTVTVDIGTKSYSIVWTVYEYPQGVKNLQELDSGDLTVIKDINWKIDE